MNSDATHSYLAPFEPHIEQLGDMKPYLGPHLAVIAGIVREQYVRVLRLDTARVAYASGVPYSSSHANT